MLKSANFEYLLDNRLKDVYFQELKEIPTMIPQLYNIMSSDKAVEYDYSVGDIGAVPEFSNKIEYQDLYGQYRSTYEHKEYATGLQIQRKLIDDEQYNVILKAPATLAVAMRRRREADAAYPFNQAFNAAVVHGDAVSLCNASHPAVGLSSVFSNTATTAISPAAISAGRLAMKKINSSSDQMVSIEPDTIVLPIDLEETLDIILKTDKQVNSANNDINFNKGRYKSVVWRALSDTNNWFLIDSTLMKKYLNWFNRIPVEFNSDSDTDTFTHKYNSYMRYSMGPSEWRWVRGYAVA
jgi:hypothetical protein